MEDQTSSTPTPNPSENVPPKRFKRKKDPIDPTRPLKKAKFEIMARELAKGESQVSAYKKAYPHCNEMTARTNACQVVAREGIHLRALHLLEAAGLTEGDLFRSLADKVRDIDSRVGLDATKFAIGLAGYGQERKLAESSYNPVQIIIEQMQINTQPIDTNKDSDNHV